MRARDVRVRINKAPSAPCVGIAVEAVPPHEAIASHDFGLKSIPTLLGISLPANLMGEERDTSVAHPGLQVFVLGQIAEAGERRGARRFSRKGKPPSVTVITEENTCSCQPMSYRSVAAMQVRIRKPSPNVTTRTVRIDQRAPSSLGPAIHRWKKGPGLRDGCKSCLLFLRRRRSKRPPPTLAVKTTRHATATVVHIGCGASKEVTWDTQHRTSEKSDPSDDIGLGDPHRRSPYLVHETTSFGSRCIRSNGWFSCASNAIRFCPSEGHHTIFNMNTSLLGGSSRPSLD